MKEIFETFQPKNPLLKKYIDYYYLDIKSDNILYEFQCFPHINNTVSLYASHIRLDDKSIYYNDTAGRLQIFTPIREKMLRIKQSGKVYRIVIVFHCLGIQQFYKNLNFAEYITDIEFFSPQELGEIFSTTDTEILTLLLDSFLEKRFRHYENPVLENSIRYIFNNVEAFTVNKLSDAVEISRQHINRNFQHHLGISVKKFHEIVLFRKTVNHKLFENPNRNFTELAYEFNYNDQSHLNKAYKNFTENSPKNFFGKGTVLGTKDTFWCLLP